MQIEKLHSGQFHVPYEGLNFRNVHGHWGAEQQKFVQKVDYGKIIFENRRGISSHNHNPYFILDQDATETTGNVYFGALRMTGNFSGAVEQTQYGETLVQMGINTHDFTWDLKPGESFASPEILCGYSADGFQTMSHNLHQFANDFLLREGLRPVLYNSWEATGFDVTVQEQKKLADAKEAEYAADSTKESSETFAGCELTGVEMKETTLTLTLKGNVKKAVFKNYKILKQEGYLLGAKWLKEEAYAVEGGKEYHVLLRKSNGTLGYLTIFAEQLTILK